MTTGLTWDKAKDGLVLFIGTGLLALLGYLANGVATANASLAEVKKDIAVILAEKQRDREELMEIKREFGARIYALEARNGR